MVDDSTNDSVTRKFEKAARQMQEGKYQFQLYVSGMTPKSLRAIENIKALCEEHLKGRYDLEIIDIYQNPGLTRDAQIVAAPTLIKKLPAPLRKFIGDLSNKEHILVKLNLVPNEAGKGIP